MQTLCNDVINGYKNVQFITDDKLLNLQFLISEMKTANPRIPSPLTAGMTTVLKKKYLAIYFTPCLSPEPETHEKKKIEKKSPSDKQV